MAEEHSEFAPNEFVAPAQQHFNTHPQRSPPSDPSNPRNSLPDSGASSHFTPYASDLINARPCHVPITVADGNTVYATQVGQVPWHFPSDQGYPVNLTLSRVYFVPGLNRCLFSIPAFTENGVFTVNISKRYTQLDFGDGTTYTWPILQHKRGCHDANQSSTPPPTPTPPNTSVTDPVPTPAPTPTTTPGKRLGFRSLQGLLSGTLGQVWDDCHVSPGADDYTWSAKIAVSCKRNRVRIDPDTPEHVFDRVFLDVIPNPHANALMPGTAFPCHLFICTHKGKLCGVRGMKNNSTAEVIRCFTNWENAMPAHGKVREIQYIRADAAKYFLSKEFLAFGDENNISIEIAAPRR